MTRRHKESAERSNAFSDDSVIADRQRATHDRVESVVEGIGSVVEFPVKIAGGVARVGLRLVGSIAKETAGAIGEIVHAADESKEAYKKPSKRSRKAA